jgi:dTDP-glucose pyrophosphorylase
MTLISSPNWQKSKLAPSASIRSAIESLNETGLKICLIVSPNDVLLGVVGDGDIRRGILKGFELDSPVSEIINDHPVSARPEMTRSEVLELMRIKDIFQLPLVDQKGIVIGLQVWDTASLVEELPNTMVIMAGGLGRRLMPYTQDCPKPMLLVDGRPILEHIIDNAIEQGFRKFILSVGYMAHMIEDHFGDGAHKKITVTYTRESEPLGTAGALSLIGEKIEVPMVVTNGDIFTDINYEDVLNFHSKNKADATMVVKQYAWQHPFGVIEMSGFDIKKIVEKPIYKSHINTGIYVFSPRVLETLERNKYIDMPTFFDSLRTQNHKTVAFPIHEPWIDIGRHEDLEKVRSAS